MGRNQNTTYFLDTFKATITKEKLIEAYNRLGKWSLVAEEFKVSHASIIIARKNLGIFYKTLTKGSQYGGLNCKNTKNGGKRKDKRGYIILGRYYPGNDRDYAIYEHTFVMEKFLGRKLQPNEAIHHIDGNKSNNDINNLFLCNHSTHRIAENSAIQLIYKLYSMNMISFNKEIGKYEFDNSKDITKNSSP